MGPADRTSQAHGMRQMIKQPAPDGRQARMRRWSFGSSFFPLWRCASADAAGTDRRSASAMHAGATRAMSGPQMIEPEFFLELLLRLLAHPACLDQRGELLERRVGRQVRQVVLALT